MPTLAFDRQFLSDSVRVIAGTDEAGRGPLAGPVVAAACILPADFLPEGLDDSKKLTEKKREKLFDIITENAISYCIASASPEEIDQYNILEASLLAMRRAIDGLSPKPGVALIDGNISRNFQIEAHAIIGGDGISPSIAAASILAKTERDKWCCEVLDREYPQYGFAKHKGYGTKAHYDAISQFGPCPEHRMSFLRKYYEKQS
jgi:ribonuclease HII